MKYVIESCPCKVLSGINQICWHEQKLCKQIDDCLVKRMFECLGYYSNSKFGDRLPNGHYRIRIANPPKSAMITIPVDEQMIFLDYDPTKAENILKELKLIAIEEDK